MNTTTPSQNNRIRKDADPQQHDVLVGFAVRDLAKKRLLHSAGSAPRCIGFDQDGPGLGLSRSIGGLGKSAASRACAASTGSSTANASAMAIARVRRHRMFLGGRDQVAPAASDQRRAALLLEFFNWALTAEVERHSRCAASAKLPHSMPTT